MRGIRVCHLVCLLSAGVLLADWAGASDKGVPGRSPPATNRRVDFKRDVYPILYARCFKCHQGADASAEYRLDDRDEILGRGENHDKPLVKVGDSSNSLL